MDVLDCCLGPNRDDVKELCQAILKMNKQVVPCWLFYCLRPDVFVPSNKYESYRRSAFDAAIWKILATP